MVIYSFNIGSQHLSGKFVDLDRVADILSKFGPIGQNSPKIRFFDPKSHSFSQIRPNMSISPKLSVCSVEFQLFRHFNGFLIGSLQFWVEIGDHGRVNGSNQDFHVKIYHFHPILVQIKQLFQRPVMVEIINLGTQNQVSRIF